MQGEKGDEKADTRRRTERDAGHEDGGTVKRVRVATSKINGTSEYRKPRIGEDYQADLPPCPGVTKKI